MLWAQRRISGHSSPQPEEAPLKARPAPSVVWSWGLNSQELRCWRQGGSPLGAVAGHVQGRWGHTRLMPAASWPWGWLHSPRSCAGPKATASLGTRWGRRCGRAHLWHKTTEGESHSSRELCKKMKSTTIQTKLLNSLYYDVIIVFWNFPRPSPSCVFSTAQSLPFRPWSFSLQTSEALLRLTFDLFWLQVLASNHSPLIWQSALAWTIFGAFFWRPNM